MIFVYSQWYYWRAVAREMHLKCVIEMKYCGFFVRKFSYILFTMYRSTFKAKRCAKSGVVQNGQIDLKISLETTN